MLRIVLDSLPASPAFAPGQSRCRQQAMLELAPRDAALLAWLALEGPTLARFTQVR
jgi:hypothetical protein